MGKRAAFTLAAVALFFSLLEGVLTLAGVRPLIQREDPFVGFAANVPLLLYGPGLFDWQIRLPYVTSHIDDMLNPAVRDRVTFMTLTGQVQPVNPAPVLKARLWI